MPTFLSIISMASQLMTSPGIFRLPGDIQCTLFTLSAAVQLETVIQKFRHRAGICVVLQKKHQLFLVFFLLLLI